MQCYFCDTRPADPQTKVEKPVYQLTKYSHLLVARRFEFSVLKVDIPRCTECSRLHKKGKKTFNWWFWSFLLTFCIFGLPIIVVALILGGAIGYLLGRMFEKKIYTRNKIKPLTKRSFETYPPITEKLLQGWTLKKPGS